MDEQNARAITEAIVRIMGQRVNDFGHRLRNIANLFYALRDAGFNDRNARIISAAVDASRFREQLVADAVTEG